MLVPFHSDWQRDTLSSALLPLVVLAKPRGNLLVMEEPLTSQTTEISSKLELGSQ